MTGSHYRNPGSCTRPYSGPLILSPLLLGISRVHGLGLTLRPIQNAANGATQANGHMLGKGICRVKHIAKTLFEATQEILDLFDRVLPIIDGIGNRQYSIPKKKLLRLVSQNSLLQYAFVKVRKQDTSYRERAGVNQPEFPCDKDHNSGGRYCYIAWESKVMKKGNNEKAEIPAADEISSPPCYRHELDPDELLDSDSPSTPPPRRRDVQNKKAGTPEK